MATGRSVSVGKKQYLFLDYLYKNAGIARQHLINTAIDYIVENKIVPGSFDFSGLFEDYKNLNEDDFVEKYMVH